MQVYKSTGDFESGKAMFEGYSAVNDEFVKFREIVLANKLPRRVELQGDFVLDYGKDGVVDVQYITWPETFEGIISSYLCHFQNDVESVLAEWNKGKGSFLHKHH
jgi:dipeptidyl-peptidase-3